MQTSKPDEFLPLSETTLYIILSLVKGPLHGYAIARQVQVLSGKQVILSVSTLYTTLKRLLDDGWIERASGDPELEASGHARKNYALTEFGRRILGAEKQRIKSLLSVVQEQTAGEGI